MNDCENEKEINAFLDYTSLKYFIT